MEWRACSRGLSIDGVKNLTPLGDIEKTYFKAS
jgi:hypothetical protein